MLGVFFLGIIVAHFNSSKNSKGSKMLFLGTLILLFYCLIIAVEGGTKQGFVFAHLHLRPESLFVAVLGTMWAFAAITSHKLWHYLTLVALSFYLARLAPIVVTQVYVTTREVVRSPLASRADKMRLNWGGFYDFTEFVNSKVPSDATIAIPPRSSTHPLVGNSSFFWYFVYPRTLVSLPLHVTEVSGVRYIVLDGGDSTWPDRPLKAKHIWYYHDLSTITELVDTVYDPSDPSYIRAMGLIELSEDEQ